METITQSSKVLYTGKAHTVGGREFGTSKSPDGRLDIKLSPPGSKGIGTNPEQLFAAGWSACFESAMGSVARSMRIKLPEETSVDAEIDLCLDKKEYSLRARLNVSIPGMESEVAHQIIEGAHQTCPYSKAIKGNVEVETNLV